MRKRKKFTFSLPNYLSALYTNLAMCGSERESFRIAFKVYQHKLIVWKAAIKSLILHKEMQHEEYKKIFKMLRNLND